MAAFREGLINFKDLWQSSKQSTLSETDKRFLDKPSKLLLSTPYEQQIKPDTPIKTKDSVNDMFPRSSNHT